MAPVSDDWHVFSVPGFPIRFCYPDPTPLGHAVEVVEEQRPEARRVHCRSRAGAEVYFEVTGYAALTPEVEYTEHTAYLATRFANQAFVATPLTEALFDSRRALAYSFRWDTFERAVVLVPLGPGLCRLLYNPQSAVNARVLATAQFIT